MKNVTVREFMTLHPVLAEPEMTLSEAARKMKEVDCGFLPVAENGKLLGIITDRDIVIRAIAEGKNPAGEKVGSYMTPRVFACSENDFLEDAIDKMHTHQVTRLVVKNRKGDVTGVLSYGGLLRQEATSSEIAQTIKHAMFPGAA